MGCYTKQELGRDCEGKFITFLRSIHNHKKGIKGPKGRGKAMMNQACGKGNEDPSWGDEYEEDDDGWDAQWNMLRAKGRMFMGMMQGMPGMMGGMPGMMGKTGKGMGNM